MALKLRLSRNRNTFVHDGTSLCVDRMSHAFYRPKPVRPSVFLFGCAMHEDRRTSTTYVMKLEPNSSLEHDETIVFAQLLELRVRDVVPREVQRPRVGSQQSLHVHALLRLQHLEDRLDGVD